MRAESPNLLAQPVYPSSMEIRSESHLPSDSPAEHAHVLVPQVWRQMEAENVDEFKQAVAMQQMPMFTYIYSSHEGDTFYQSNSWTPDYSGMPVAYDWAVA